jgi:hypothetical protein
VRHVLLRDQRLTRNIKLDIEKFKEPQSLYASDEFWRTFITKASRVKTAEPQLWDFKETLNVWHLKDDPARRQAKVTFEEDVASLANTQTLAAEFSSSA